MGKVENIYIIYSNKDEDDVPGNSWTQSFQRFLKLLLKRLTGNEINIEAISSDEFNVDKHYSISTIVVPIISLNLLGHGVFKHELKQFYERAIQKETNNLLWNQRIFKVVRYPVGGHFLMDFLNDVNTYNFFHTNSKGEVVTYNDFTGPESEKTFWMRLYDLAYDITKVLEKIHATANDITSISQDINQKYVYLSLVGEDLYNERDIIKRELTRNGYKVLPEGNPSDDVGLIVRQLEKDLEKSLLSIHLVGEDMSIIRGTNISMVELQNRVASEYFNKKSYMSPSGEIDSLGRVIWISPNINIPSLDHKKWIEALKRDVKGFEHAEYLEVPLEEFKLFLNKKLESINIEPSVRLYSTGARRSKSIYLICDKMGLDKSKPVVNYLNSIGIEVIMSKFSGTPDEMRLEHLQNLKKCDASLIYYTNDNRQWMKSKMNDLMKVLGLGREKPISPRAVLFDNEKLKDDNLIIDNEAIVLYNKDRFSPDIIQPFLLKLER